GRGRASASFFLPTRGRPSVPEPRVLLAEDDASVRKVVQGLLEDAGLAVVAAKDGQEALERFSTAAPDVVVADINMPRMDGLELLDRLKALDPEVLVIFVTAYSSVDSAVSALRKGAFDYIAKPFRNDQLLQVDGGVRRDEDHE